MVRGSVLLGSVWPLASGCLALTQTLPPGGLQTTAAEGSLTATSWLCWARVGKGCLSTVGGGRELLLGRWWSGLDMHSLLGRGALGCDGLRATFLKPWLCWGGLRCPGGAPGRREVA